MPKVSVIIPTYNREKYLPEAINSVLNQTYKDFEIIIVDDGSRDNTKEVVESFMKKYPHIPIRYFYQENKGPAAARNRGIKEAKGEYIAFLDSDDIWLPEMLKESLDFLKKHNFDWVTCASYEKDGFSKSIRRLPQYLWDKKTHQLHLLKEGIFFFSEIPNAGCFLSKKSCFIKIGMFDESFRIGEDTDIYLRLEEAGFRGGYLDKPLLIYRVNESSITRSKNYSGLWQHVILAKKHAKILGMKNSIIRRSYSEFLWRCAEIFINSQKFLYGFRCFLRSWYLWPSKEKIRRMLRFIKRRIKRCVLLLMQGL
ncbi:MAG: hypothetical protein B6D55_07685 [Candidatus Omnitrophica bacterium 4484_70.2]|nr:MAG: hypothetical protein B6D55_07685 [Candidatus Omnitrophica bacterium 4484_70.2]